MLDKIIRFSLTHGLWIVVGSLLIIAGGLYTTDQMDIDVFPDLTAPTVVVMTDAENMAAEEVERLVTFPIETAVNGATDVRRVRSSSMPGYSFVWVEFDWGTDIFKARQIVSEKMVTLSESLPPDVTPVLAPQSSVMGEIIFIGLQASTTSMMDLRTLAEWVIKPAILATGGVSQVTIIGGDYKQYQVLADPVRMNAYDVTLADIEDVLRALGENASGGVIRQYGNEYALRGMSRTTDLTEMEETLIKVYEGKPVFLGDVAKVQIGSAVKMGYASQNGRPAVLLSVSKQPNVNTLEVTRNIEKRMMEIQSSLPEDVVLDTEIFKQADFIEASVHNVGRALLEGAVFVIVILFLFLGSFRTTLISVLAIPLSLLGTMIVLYLLGMNINTMTLGGMCIAIGSLIDDAIIDVENVYKRLRENHLLPKAKRRSVTEVVFSASTEIRASILNATFIIIVAFVPLFFLSGMEGRMLKPLGIAYIVSLLMSLLVAMTITPLLCRYMLGTEKYLAKQDKEGRFTRWLRNGYSRSLLWALNHKKTVVGTALVLLLGAGYLYTTFGHGFLPDFNEGSLTISVVTQPGISLEENHQVGNLVESQLLQIPEVRGTSRRTGRGELDEHSQAINSAEIDVKFTLRNRSREAFMEDVRAHLAAIPGIASTVGQPLGHRIDHMLSGTRANIAIKLFGTDLSRLFQIANQIKSDIADIDGLVDVSVEQQTLTPEWHIRPDRAALARYGISLSEFNDFVRTAFAGNVVAQVYEGQRSFDLMVRLMPDYTNTIEGVRSALIATGSGKKVTLEEVAEIVSVGGANSISRENVERKIVVAANVAGRDLQGAVDEIEKTIREKIVLPEGYHIAYGGQFESARSASRTLLLASLAALLIVFMLLYVEFKEVSLSVMVLLNLPLALIGGIAAIYLTSGIVSIPSIIGFITLFGIATRNGILLVSRYRHLQAEGLSLRDLIRKGSEDRLNPILMTALTSALALVPLVLNGDQSGNEIQSPMAVVVLGGLLTSTLLNIYVIPVVYEWFRKRQISTQTISGGFRDALTVVTVGLFLFALPAVTTPARAQSAKSVNPTVASVPVSGLADVSVPQNRKGDTAALYLQGTPVDEARSYADSKELMADLEHASPALQALKSAAEAEKFSYKIGLVPEDPEVDFSYRWGVPKGVGNEAEFEVTQSFEFPTVYAYAKKLSDLNVRSAELRYERARMEWYVEVRQLCVRVIYYNAIEKLWRRRMEQADSLLTAYQKSFRLGETNSLDMNKARMNWVKLRNEYQNLLIDRESLEMELSRLMGGVPVRLLQTEFDPMAWPADFEKWYNEMSIWHPALMLSESEVDAARKNVSLNTAHAFPSFKVGYKGDNVFGDESLHGLVVGMRVPLWENKNKLKQAKLANMSAEMSLKDVQLATRAKYTTLYAKAVQLQKTVEEYRKTIAEAGNTTLLGKALRAGEMSLLEYLVEQDYLFELYTVYWEAYRDLALIYAEWEALEAQK
ncbi:MAG: CusA/CzcA family heavy metal efflux RND transporter [Bacteroidales bacterium]|nr:CusA/CzcA family heavy metal efflux RND transporter [Bacteroidales bacterium]